MFLEWTTDLIVPTKFANIHVQRGLGEHANIDIVRDDLVPGGTKGRFLIPLFQQLQNAGFKEVVYPSTAYGAAIVGLSRAAQATEMKVAAFIAARSEDTYTDLMREVACQHLGHPVGARKFKFHFVSMGFYPKVIAAARKYAQQSEDRVFLDCGLRSGYAIQSIKNFANYLLTQITDVGRPYDACFYACASGTLNDGLTQSSIARNYYSVVTGMDPGSTAGSTPIWHNKIQPFERPAKVLPPYPTVPNYDGKVWSWCLNYANSHPLERVLLWNVYATATDRERIKRLENNVPSL